MIQLHSYGASDGYPSQHGIIKDAQVCFLTNINSRILVVKLFAIHFVNFITFLCPGCIGPPFPKVWYWHI